MQKYIMPIIALLILLVCLGIAGKEDLIEAAREHIEYCENVNSHVWPDFKDFKATGECEEKILRDYRKFFK